MSAVRARVLRPGRRMVGPGRRAAVKRSSPAAKSSPPRLQLLVPAYFYPAGEGAKHWDRLLAAAEDVPIVAIVNPDSGPGKGADAAHARGQKETKLVVFNPGTTCDERFVSEGAADAACLFEGPKALDAATLPDWARKKSRQVVVLSYKIATAGDMRKCVANAATNQVGYLYITDDGANPWDRLPSYWDDEVKAVREVNARRE